MTVDFKINGKELVFVNFFKSANETEENYFQERDRTDALESDVDDGSNKYYINTIEGIKNRMIFAAEKGILYAQLGNTTTYIFSIDGVIYGLNSSLKGMLEVYKKTSIDVNTIVETYKKEVEYDCLDTGKESNKQWYKDRKKEIEQTIDSFIEFKNRDIKYLGNISNEMWRIMAAEPDTMKKYELVGDHYNDLVKIEIEPGDYTFTSDYFENKSIYFVLKKK